MRLEFAEFKNRILAQVEALDVTQNALETLDSLLLSGDRIWPSESEEVLGHLESANVHTLQLHVFIERSHYLPLSVVPYRLPLIFALQETESHINKLKGMLIELRDKAFTDLDQSTEDLSEIRNESGLLQAKHDEVLEHLGILLDRARFKEREYNTFQSASYRA